MYTGAPEAHAPAEFLVYEIQNSGGLQATPEMLENAAMAVEKKAGVAVTHRQYMTPFMSELEGREEAHTVLCAYFDEDRERANAQLLGMSGENGAVRVGADGAAALWTIKMQEGSGAAVTVTVVVYPDGESDELELGSVLPPLQATEAKAGDGAEGDRGQPRPMELRQAQADRTQNIKIVVRMLGKLKVMDEGQRDAQLRELHHEIAHELTAIERGLKAQEMGTDASNNTWKPAGAPSLLMRKDTITIDAAIFSLKREGAERVEIVKLRGTGHKGDPMVINLRLPGMKTGKSMSMLIGTAVPRDKKPGAKATVSLLAGHVCEGGWAMKHPVGQACRGMLAARVRRDGSKEVQEVCQAIDDHEKARVGPFGACCYYALYTAEKGVQAFCGDGTERKGGGCWQKSATCGWDRPEMIPPDVEELRAKLLAAKAPAPESTEVKIAFAKNPAKQAVAKVMAVESPHAMPPSPRMSKCYYCEKYFKVSTNDAEWACEECEKEIDEQAEAAGGTGGEEGKEAKESDGEKAEEGEEAAEGEMEMSQGEEGREEKGAVPHRPSPRRSDTKTKTGKEKVRART